MLEQGKFDIMMAYARTVALKKGKGVMSAGKTITSAKGESFPVRFKPEGEVEETIIKSCTIKNTGPDSIIVLLHKIKGGPDRKEILAQKSTERGENFDLAGIASVSISTRGRARITITKS